MTGNADDGAAVLPVKPLSPPCPGTPEIITQPPAPDADYRLPPPLQEMTPPAISPIQSPAEPVVLGATVVDSPTHVAHTADTQAFFGEDFDLPAWIDGDEMEPQSPVSSGTDSVFEQMTLPPPPQVAQPTMVRPILAPRDLVTIARSTFGIAQTQILVPAILEGFVTTLTGNEVAERLQLLWLMRRDVASQVRDILLLGQARREPAGLVLMEVLDLVEQYIENTQ